MRPSETKEKGPGDFRIGLRRGHGEMDQQAISRIWLVTQHSVYDNASDLFDPDRTAHYVAHVLFPYNRVFVAVVEKEVTGFISLFDECVSQLHVAPEWQRKGIGSALLEMAKKHSEGRLRLSCFREKVGQFYRNQGFLEKHSPQAAPQEGYVEYEWNSSIKPRRA